MFRGYYSWLFIAVVLVIAAYFFHYLAEDSSDIDFSISVIGTGFTVLGIAVTFDQIRKTATKADETRRAVEETKNRMQTITKAFNMTDAIRLAESTEVYLRNKNPGESLIKLQEFTQILISINDEELKSSNLNVSQRITRQMQFIKLDISSLNMPKEECRDIDWKTIITHVEETKNLLAEHLVIINKTV